MWPPLFHSLQFTAQAWQPTQMSRSMTRPSLRVLGFAGREVTAASTSFGAAAESRAIAQDAGPRLAVRERRQRRERRIGLAGLFRRRLLDAHAQVVPGRLAGDGIAVGPAVPVGPRRQQLGDDVVQEESIPGFWRIRRQGPGPLALADGVPGPDRVFVYAVHQLHLHLDAGMMADDPGPIVVGKLETLGGLPVHVQFVAAMDLPQPRVLRTPGMVHGHRPLRDGVQPKLVRVDRRLFERGAP